MSYKIITNQNGNNTTTDNNKANVMVGSQSDLAGLPENLAIGTIAHTAGYKKVWEKAMDGSWVEV